MSSLGGPGPRSPFCPRGAPGRDGAALRGRLHWQGPQSARSACAGGVRRLEGLGVSLGGPVRQQRGVRGLAKVRHGEIGTPSAVPPRTGVQKVLVLFIIPWHGSR